MTGHRQCVTLDGTELNIPVLCLKKSITKRACKFGPWIAPLICMDFEKMKALMEASREESAAQRKPQVEEFPKPDSGPDWIYLGYGTAKERIAA